MIHHMIHLSTWVITGRALEDLRASLFNELRALEGARRQQQRLCGPAAALTFNFVVAVGIIFVNKLVCNLNYISLNRKMVACQLVICSVLFVSSGA